MNYDLMYKVVIIGNSGVGKTSIVNKKIRNMYSPMYSATIGVEYDCILLDSIKLQIWDTTGIEKYASICKSYLGNSTIIMYVFDISNRKTFLDLPKWIDDTYKKDRPAIIVGNKCDLKRNVTFEEATLFADKYDMDYIEVSAKNNTNIAELFTNMVDIIQEYIKNNKIDVNNNSLGIYNKKPAQPPPIRFCCFL